MLHLSGPVRHDLATNPMETLYVLLIDPLDRHKTHRWALHCFTDGLSIGLVILVGLDTGLNKLGSDQLHLVSKIGRASCRERV